MQHDSFSHHSLSVFSPSYNKQIVTDAVKVLIFFSDLTLVICNVIFTTLYYYLFLRKAFS